MEIEQTQDVCVRKLTSTEGKDLEITANLTHPSQVTAILEGYVDRKLGSKYGVEKAEFLMRLSCSFNGRAREDLTTIGGKQAMVPGWIPGQGINNDR